MVSTLAVLRRCPTAAMLLEIANIVPINCYSGNVVFYHGKSGSEKAEQFVRRNPHYKRLDDLLRETELGSAFLDGLIALSRTSFREVEEVWWIVSSRLAAQAQGDVHVFGGDVYKGGFDRTNANLSGTQYKQFLSRYGDSRLMDTTFDKVELPILLTNQAVGRIFYNEKLTDW